MANSPSGESVLDRVMRMLTALETEPELTPSGLAREAGLPKSTAYRLIEDLTRRGLLERGPDGQISLGRRLWEIAQRTPLAATLRQTALPYMEDLNAVVQQTTQLSVLDGTSVMIVERLSRTGAVVNPAEVASRMPVHLTSMGHAILAFSARSVVDDVLRRHGERIAAERPQFRAELAETRRRGYASLDHLIHRNTTGISAPILDVHGRAQAAITVVVPSDSVNLGMHVMALKTAARGIASRLRGQAQAEDRGPQPLRQHVVALAS
ncbi:IclR family transcriptional regulator [Nesterenkonia flava]|uniref:IclR family transcriptional regulator n=1 Tax=Nesterenkonia flava TaxID=469799 RepID=A0ABU1FPK5_9MICC|nr:IclR family transcriptional regulator [Nesterenkonia flava]MDR5710578.1 IclR family transcriptional regulator [Nesterenkonia flava]